MKNSVLHTALAALLVPALFSCTEEPRNTEPLVDPWLRERTPVNLRLESQIGAAVISDDWRNDAEGSIVVNLITSGLDMSAVKVEALDFKFPDSEFCPKASVAPGGTLDFSSGTANSLHERAESITDSALSGSFPLSASATEETLEVSALAMSSLTDVAEKPSFRGIMWSLKPVFIFFTALM